MNFRFTKVNWNFVNEVQGVVLRQIGDYINVSIKAHIYVIVLKYWV